MFSLTYQMLVTEMGLSLLSHNKQLEIRTNEKKWGTYCCSWQKLQYSTLFSCLIVWVASFKYEYRIDQVLRLLEDIFLDGLHT